MVFLENLNFINVLPKKRESLLARLIKMQSFVSGLFGEKLAENQQENLEMRTKTDYKNTYR